MGRRGELERELSTLLSPRRADEIDLRTRESGAEDCTPRLTRALITDLAASDSGMGFVYRALDRIVDEFNLRDAALIIDHPGLGRQVFQSGRRLLEEDKNTLLVAPPGLRTDPPLESAEFDEQMLVDLCAVALRLDLIRYDAWHDPLTGLFDRRSFDRLLDLSIARSKRYGWSFTLVILDVDGLKLLNDREGHAAGDTALRELGERFSRELRFGDEAARIGGDEFALILPETDPKVVPDLVKRVETGGDGWQLSLSFGIARCPAEADEYEALFHLADQRLYEAKHRRS